LLSERNIAHLLHTVKISPYQRGAVPLDERLGLRPGDSLPSIQTLKPQDGDKTMETRLKKLERWNKVLLAGLALALLPWVVGAAAKIPDLIEGTSGRFQTVGATTFDLLDEQGNKVGGFMGRKAGSNLTIKDSNGKIRIFVGLLKGNPTLLFADKDGDAVATYAEKNGSFETVK